MKNSSFPLRRFIAYLKPVKWTFIGAILCGIYKFGLPVVNAWLLGQMVEVLVADGAAISEKMKSIITLACIGGALALFSPLFVYYRHTLAAIGTFHVINDLRVDLFSHVQQSDMV